MHEARTLVTKSVVQRRNRLLLIGGGSAALTVVAMLGGWVAFGDQSGESVAARGDRQIASTITSPTTTITEPARREAVPTTSSEPVTSLTTPREEPAEPCTDDALSVMTETDRSSYFQGATVRIQSTARNVSADPCRIGGVTDLVIGDSAGNAVLLLSVADLQAEGSAGDGTAPGGSLSWATEWNQHGASGDRSGAMGQVPPGRYSVTVTWGSVARGSAFFEIQG